MIRRGIGMSMLTRMVTKSEIANLYTTQAEVCARFLSQLAGEFAPSSLRASPPAYATVRWCRPAQKCFFRRIRFASWVMESPRDWSRCHCFFPDHVPVFFRRCLQSSAGICWVWALFHAPYIKCLEVLRRSSGNFSHEEGEESCSSPVEFLFSNYSFCFNRGDFGEFFNFG